MKGTPGESGKPLRLLVVGAGALGNALLPHVVHWGWAYITVMDGDRVEGKNLGRQALFTEADLGSPKSGTVAAWMRGKSFPVECRHRDEFLDANNADGAVAGHDIVADCTDDAHAKRLIDRACAHRRVALVSGSVHGRQAQVIVLHAEGEGAGITRDLLFGGKPGMAQDGCDMRDVPMGTIGAAGQRMAAKLQALFHGERVANGTIDLYDGERWTGYVASAN